MPLSDFKKVSVFISGPFSATNDNDEMDNTLNAAKVQAELLDRGYAVFCPHTSYFWLDQIHPREYEVWMDQCLQWLSRCDIVVRLPGVSPGSDREEAHAKQLGIPVVMWPDGLALWEALN